MSGPLAFFAVLGIILTMTPWVSVAGAALVVALHFWAGVSWLWMTAPGALFVAWAAFFVWARKGVV